MSPFLTSTGSRYTSIPSRSGIQRVVDSIRRCLHFKKPKIESRLPNVYIAWNAAANALLESLNEKDVATRLEYIELVKSVILAGHSHYVKCMKMKANDTLKIAVFETYFGKLSTLYMLVYRKAR